MTYTKYQGGGISEEVRLLTSSSEEEGSRPMRAYYNHSPVSRVFRGATICSLFGLELFVICDPAGSYIVVCYVGFDPSEDVSEQNEREGEK